MPSKPSSTIGTEKLQREPLKTHNDFILELPELVAPSCASAIEAGVLQHAFPSNFVPLASPRNATKYSAADVSDP